MLALVSKVLRIRRGNLRRAKALQGRRVAGGNDDNTLFASLGAKGPFEELTHLAAALAHQGDHHDVRLGATGHGTEQRAFAHAGTSKEPDALPSAERGQAVEHPHPGLDGLSNGVPRQRGDRILIDGDELAAWKLAQAVDGSAQAVDHTAQEAPRHGYLEPIGGALDFVVESYATKGAKGHGHRKTAIETDNFTRQTLAGPANEHQITDANAPHAYAARQAGYGHDRAKGVRGRGLPEPFAELVEIGGHGG
jgi:hypothetical protein